MTERGENERFKRLISLFWLADAPLFIDEKRVGQFFDAVVRPKYEHVLITEERSHETEDKWLSELGIEAKAGFPDWIPEWLMPIKLEAGVSGKLSGEEKSIERAATISQLKPIWNAERQLEELTRHYLIKYKDRIILLDGLLDRPHDATDKRWFDRDSQIHTKVPRPIIFLDLAGVKLLPMAAEFKDGTISLLFEDLTARLTGEKGGPLREFPSDDDPQYNEKRTAYWASFDEFFESKEAMLVVEEASKKYGRINWIDFRLPLNSEGDTLHVHITPEGNADAGVFGYNLIRRGFKHGIRLVGTLKSGRDMNVLAIYEK